MHFRDIKVSWYLQNELELSTLKSMVVHCQRPITLAWVLTDLRPLLNLETLSRLLFYCQALRKVEHTVLPTTLGLLKLKGSSRKSACAEIMRGCALGVFKKDDNSRKSVLL
jgi:hypothetical protein